MGDPPPLPSDSQVDVEQIGKAPAWLEQLQVHVETYCLGQMTNIAAALNTSALDTTMVLVSTRFSLLEGLPSGAKNSAVGCGSHRDMGKAAECRC